MKVLILHGVNLCMLGQRDPEIYGTMTETDLLKTLRAYAPDDRIDLFPRIMKRFLSNAYID